MKVSDLGQRPANMPFTKTMALSILKAEFNSFSKGQQGIDNETRKFILHHFPELSDSADFEISSGLVMNEEEPMTNIVTLDINEDLAGSILYAIGCIDESGRSVSENLKDLAVKIGGAFESLECKANLIRELPSEDEEGVERAIFNSVSPVHYKKSVIINGEVAYSAVYLPSVGELCTREKIHDIQKNDIGRFFVFDGILHYLPELPLDVSSVEVVVELVDREGAS